jgi:ABC-type antimicrobial peptide transport system permease subunit
VDVAVVQQTREIGIRRALGAGSFGVLAPVFRRAAMQLGAGIGVANVAIACIGSLMGLSVGDFVLPLIGISGLVVLVGFGACALPAWRALNIQPINALNEA